jgi:hypothetical protein
VPLPPCQCDPFSVALSFHASFPARLSVELSSLALKMERLPQWCEDINRVQSDVRYDFVYVDQEGSERYRPASFRQLMAGFREYRG